MRHGKPASAPTTEGPVLRSEEEQARIKRRDFEKFQKLEVPQLLRDQDKAEEREKAAAAKEAETQRKAEERERKAAEKLAGKAETARRRAEEKAKKAAEKEAAKGKKPKVLEKPAEPGALGDRGQTGYLGNDDAPQSKGPLEAPEAPLASQQGPCQVGDLGMLACWWVRLNQLWVTLAAQSREAREKRQTTWGRSQERRGVCRRPIMQFQRKQAQEIQVGR